MPENDLPLRRVDVRPARSLRERSEAVLSFAALLAVDLLGRVGGFALLHGLVRRFPTWGAASCNLDRAERICTAVDRAAAWYIKRSWCLNRSVVATILLRLFGVPGQLVLGVRKLPFMAHAWVELEGRVLNDNPRVQIRYTVLDRC